MALRRGHLECGANCWPDAVTSSQHVYEVRPRKDHRGVDLISDVLPFGRFMSDNRLELNAQVFQLLLDARRDIGARARLLRRTP